MVWIGNEADPVTPYVMAKKVADALGDSAILIQQDDYGVSTLYELQDGKTHVEYSIHPSLCTRTGELSRRALLQ